jgi:DNA (cytosine-5)-methyltransferase 1
MPFNETGWDSQEKRIHDVRRGLAPTLSARSKGGGTVDGWFAVESVAFDTYNQQLTQVSPTLRNPHGTFGDALPAVFGQMSVRRLTPVECERLQGFPDNYTRIPWKGKPADVCPDGGRYKALGNSMAVNCMRWIGRRIELVEKA